MYKRLVLKVKVSKKTFRMGHFSKKILGKVGKLSEKSRNCRKSRKIVQISREMVEEVEEVGKVSKLFGKFWKQLGNSSKKVGKCSVKCLCHFDPLCHVQCWNMHHIINGNERLRQLFVIVFNVLRAIGLKLDTKFIYLFTSSIRNRVQSDGRAYMVLKPKTRMRRLWVTFSNKTFKIVF